MTAPISLPGCRRVAAPSGGFYRVTSWHEPFDPPPAPPAIEDEADEREPAGRWDDPDGLFRTLYCATAAEGAIAEKLADFALNPAAAIRVEAPSELGAKLLDVNHWRTHLATAPAVGELLLRFGLRTFDRRAILYERRNFTRRLAGIWRLAATTPSGELSIRGLRFRSRLPPAWICWALWEPLPLDSVQQTAEAVTIDHQALRSAALRLGVLLAD